MSTGKRYPKFRMVLENFSKDYEDKLHFFDYSIRVLFSHLPCFIKS